MTIRAIFLCITFCTVESGNLISTNTATNVANVCTSMECQNVAFKLLNTIDPTINPCEDFYEFACGSYLKSAPIDINNKFSNIIQSEIYEDVMKLMEADIEPNEPKHFKLVKILWRSCMNTAAIEANGLEPFRKYLRDLGGWPVVEGDSWNGRNFDWRRTIYKFRRAGKFEKYYIGAEVGHLIHFAIEHTRVIPYQRIMTLRTPLGILLPTYENMDFYQNHQYLSDYLASMVRIATELGANADRAFIEIREIISFEQSLTQIKLRSSQGIKWERYNPMTIAEFNKKYPTVPWMTYIRQFVPSSIPVNKKDIINVPDPDYYVELEALMAKTSKRLQANYVMSRIALRNALISTEDMRSTVYDIITRRPLGPTIRERAHYCAAEIMDHLWQGVAAMYMDKYLDTETKDAANAVVMNLEWQLRMKLVAYPWLEGKAWKPASDKITGFVNNIGYPNGMLDRPKLEHLYGKLEFTEDDYFGNMDRLSKHDHQLGIEEMKKPWTEIDEAAFIYGPVEMNTEYNPFRNSIYITVGNLRGLFFGKDRPKYMNYGGLGFVVGHEMTHAFFEDGCYRSPIGRYTSYCGLSQRLEFASRAQCLINQYESYLVDNIGTKLNGTKTLSENLADVGGMRLAYDAYDGWAAINAEEPKLPGLERYTAKQMFWVATAIPWCRKIDPATIPHTIETMIHSLDKFRVIGALSNMPEFAQDFQCRNTSLMNPVKRCDVWHSS